MKERYANHSGKHSSPFASYLYERCREGSGHIEQRLDDDYVIVWFGSQKQHALICNGNGGAYHINTRQFVGHNA